VKAAVCTRYGPAEEVLKIAGLEKPTPKRNEVCVRIHATVVTGSDIIVRGSRVSPALWLPMRIVMGFKGPRNPVLGFVLAGEVESRGQDVLRFEPGDRIFGSTMMPNVPVGSGLYDQLMGAVIKQNVAGLMGTYAEYKCLPEGSLIATMPSNTTYEEAAAIPYGAGLALHFLRKGGVGRGQKVLICGASGAIGSSAVQLAGHLGADVTGVCSTGNLELVRSLGADAVVDYTTEDFTDRGVLYDLILDAVPSGMTNRRHVRLRYEKALAPGGRYVSIDDGRPAYYADDLMLFKELVEQGELRPVIDRCYPLEQIAEAHRYVETGHKKGNVVITLGAGRAEGTDVVR
jgi:NADPH:quinone reductase-like Zn-dependent oxidoreductase